MTALRPLARSWQSTTCSCPPCSDRKRVCSTTAGGACAAGGGTHVSHGGDSRRSRRAPSLRVGRAGWQQRKTSAAGRMMRPVPRITLSRGHRHGTIWSYRGRRRPRDSRQRIPEGAGVALASSVMVPYAAYLRVYEPLAAFPEPERSHWSRYAGRAGHAHRAGRAAAVAGRPAAGAAGAGPGARERGRVRRRRGRRDVRLPVAHPAARLAGAGGARRAAAGLGAGRGAAPGGRAAGGGGLRARGGSATRTPGRGSARRPGTSRCAGSCCSSDGEREYAGRT